MILQFSFDFIHIVVLCGVLAVLIHGMFFHTSKPKKTPSERYTEDLKNFKIAIEGKEVADIELYGDQLISNPCLTQEDKHLIYDVVKSYINTSEDVKELMNPLWNEVHSKIHGHKPSV